MPPRPHPQHANMHPSNMPVPQNAPVQQRQQRPQIDPESQQAQLAKIQQDPRKIREAKRRGCLTCLTGISVFLICCGAFAFLNKHNRREIFMSPDNKFLQTLYADPPDNGVWYNVTEKYPPYCAKAQLPSGFLWGTVSSAFQIEGAVNADGKGDSIWDAFAHRKDKLIDNGDVPDISADHYHRFAQDVQLLKSYGVKAYRFSISWPRIVPLGAASAPVNPKGLAFYSNLTDLLIKAGITPVATLYHWDLPLALDNVTDFDPRDAGWTDPLIIAHFRRYAEVVFSTLGDRIKHWITFNEPYTICQSGYAGDQVAPGKKSANPFRCMHHLLLSHAEAVKVYREGKYGGKIGVALNGDYLQPANEKDWKDIAAADRLNQAIFGWFAEPLFKGQYPTEMKARFGTALPEFSPDQATAVKGSYDFIGINHFTSRWVTRVANAAPETYAAKTFQYNYKGKVIGPSTGSDWLKSVPWGLNRMLRWVDHRYGQPEIWVTANGVSGAGEDFMLSSQAANDTERVQYFKNYIDQMCLASSDYNVKLGGYFAYTFLDGFEWRKGFTERYGIFSVNLTSLERTPKQSAIWLQEFWSQAPAGRR